ncbi:DUF4244 domain-containing protein [Streptomyces sp. NPDC005899]
MGKSNMGRAWSAVRRTWADRRDRLAGNRRADRGMTTSEYAVGTWFI